MEFVYVIKRYDLFDLSFPHGFVPRSTPEGFAEVERYLARVRERAFFAERRFVEQDSSFKQVIPYCIVTHEEQVFVLRRLPSQGEERLHGKLSVGVGGHINPVDEGDPLEIGRERELAEEVTLACPYTVEPLGIINDDATPVGSVHFGVVFHVRAETDDVRVRETDQMEGLWTQRADLARIPEKLGGCFETWSELTLRGLSWIP